MTAARILARPIAALLAGMLLAALAVAAPATAQMGTQVELTPQSVEGIIASYPEVKAKADELRAKYHVPDSNGGDNIGKAWGAWLAYGDAMSQFNAVVQAHGFTDFQNWLQTLVSVATAYSFAKNGPEMDSGMQTAVDQIKNNPSLSDAQKKQMIDAMTASMGVLSAMKPSDNNLKAVEPYMDQIAATLDF